MTALTFHFTVPSNPVPPAVPDNSDWAPQDSITDNRFKIVFSSIPDDVDSIDVRAGALSLPFEEFYTVTGSESFPLEVEFPFDVPEDDIKVWVRYWNANGSSQTTDDPDSVDADNGYQTVTVTNAGSDSYAPSYITLSSSSFNAASSSPVTVGTLSSNGDPAPTFSIESDPSGLFSVSTASLVATGSWTAGQTYPITVRASNSEGVFDQQFNILAQDQTQTTYERDTLRSEMVAAHEVPRSIDSYNTFTGFSSTAGFTTVTVYNANDMFAALRTYAGSTTAKVIIELAWNGASYNANLSHVLGPTAGSLSANSSHPCGYNRPSGGHILVRPATGYDPLVRCSGTSPIYFFFHGMNVMEWRDVNFRGFRMYFNGGNFGGSGRPLMPAIAFNRCGFAAQSGPVVNDGWAFHQEGNTFDSCGIGFSGWAVHWRTFNNFWYNQQPIDIIGIRRAANSNVNVSNELANVWYRGNLMADTQDYYDADHADYFQFGGGDGGGFYQVGGMNILCEENMMYSNGRTQRGWQGTPFGHDVSGVSQFVIINNITVVTGNHGCVIYDQSGEGDVFVENNHFIRSGNVRSGGNAWIRFSSETGSKPGFNGGGVHVRRNYMKSIQGATSSNYGQSQIPGIEVSGNVLCDNPTDYNSLFSGSFSGGWTLEDMTTTNKQTLRNAFRSRFQPVGGWDPDSCGPSDPMNWLYWDT